MNYQPSLKHALLLSLLLPLAFVLKLDAQSLSRVEPTNWWAGMKNSKLQLLLYGEDIGHLMPSIDYEGVVVKRSIRVKNPNYLFVDLDLSGAKAGTFEIILKEGQKEVLSYSYELMQREAWSASREGFNSSDVMYLVTPDRFANGDEDNDGVKGLTEQPNRSKVGGRHGGDVQGLINQLDYVNDMGFTALWINPILENNQSEYSYHGYSTTDYYKVDARYGSNELYKKLVSEAKKKGIKSIMDMIVNHCGSEHWWMKDLPTDDWVNYQGEEFQQSNHRRQALQDPYAATEDARRHNDGWFVRSMPDLNQNNPLMAQYLIQNSIWWVEYAGLTGIRMDTYSYPDKHFMTEWTRRMMEEYPNLNIVGEEWSDNPVIVSYWQQGKRNKDGYVSYLPSLMDFPLQSVLSQSMKEKESPYAGGLIKLYRMLANDVLYPDPNNLVVFMDNHDMSRFYTQMDEDAALLKLGMAYLLTTRGIPQLYYGTEILMSNKGTEDHGVIRSDFPGGWKGDKVNAFTGKGLSAEAKDMQQYTKKILHWRKGNTVISQGSLVHYAPENGVYAYFRAYQGKTVMVVLNKNEKETALSLDRFADNLAGVAEGHNIIDGKDYRMDKEALSLPAKSAMILELK